MKQVWGDQAKLNKTPSDIFPRVKESLLKLQELEKAHLQVGKEMLRVADGALYTTDLMLVGVLKRSLDLIDAIQLLVERWNFCASAPMLRLQLSNLLLLAYLSTCQNVDDLCLQLLEGKDLNRIKDKEGKNLTDARLRDYARPQFPWVDDVYKATSKLVHFSERHVFISSNTLDTNNGIVSLQIGKGSPRWAEEDIYELLQCTVVTTEGILNFVRGWAKSKSSLPT
jgi:hypothetical protein